ncbi:MAG TPA: AAA domain-containing protein, partial [Pyrinomonadaceae bacterium]
MSDVPKSEVEDYKIFTEYEHTVKDLPGVQLNASSAESEDEIWFTVARLRETPAPLPPTKMLEIWLDNFNDPNNPPRLKTSVTAQTLGNAGIKLTGASGEPPQPASLIALESFQLKERVENEFKEYLDKSWNIWSASEKPRRRTIGLYGKLFSLKQQLEGGITDAQIELIWGIGIAVWKINGKNVRFPLITKGVELSLNEKTMAIEIRPRELDPRVELEIYSNADNPGVPPLQKAAREFFSTATETISPFEKSTFEGLLRSAVAFLDSKGIYLPDEDSPDKTNRNLPPAAENLKITDSWVLFARPRGASLFINDLERFQHTLKRGAENLSLPPAVAAIVTEPSTVSEDVPLPSFRGISMVSGNSSAAGSQKAKDLFFPMPFNDEQVRIVQLLEQSDGVVVQGPPGTGKTHTIANIICHYLALGKRVLVTSMREPALTVLQEKLPEEIQPLAVSLLVNEKAGMKQFQFAIERIASIVQLVNKDNQIRQIAQQEAEIDNYHFKIAGCDSRIAAWARANLTPFQIDGEQLEPRQAAEEVIKNLEEIEWFEDEISIEKNFDAKFTDDDIQSLRQARKVLGEDLSYLGCKLPEISSLPDVREVLQAHQNLSRLAELEEQVDAGSIPHLTNLSDETFRAARTTLQKIDSLKKLRQEIVSSGANWLSSMIQRLRNNLQADILTLFSQLGTEIEAAIKENQNYLSKPITLPENFEQNPKLIEAAQNLSEGTRPFGLIGMFGKSIEKRQIEAVKILGSSPSGANDWAFVLEFINYRKRLSQLILRWNALAGELQLPVLPVEQSSVSVAARIFGLYKKLTAAVQLELILFREINNLLPDWKDARRIAGDERIVLEAERFLSLHLNKNKLAQTWAIKERFNNVLTGCSGKIVNEFRDFYENSFGNPETSDTNVQNEWSRLTEELRRIHSIENHLEAVGSVAKSIAGSGAFKWAERLRNEPMVSSSDFLLPDNWRKIWRWKRLATFLEKIDSRAELRSLMAERSENERHLAKTYQETIKNRTWLKLKENTSPLVSSALEAYRTAIAKIGKGTGKRAVRYRQDARNAASAANPAIPCWIMPHYRISESLPAEFGCFDLVIVDEASQSDLTALPALLRAKKVLIVGDDKQVSPEGVGMLEDRIKKLMNQFLTNQVETFRSQLTPERSIYDLFKVVFAKDGVTLKEHFRCAAPIIEYSKREFYNHELVPLRLPKASERLAPPLIDVLVEDGVKLKDINKPEAEFIVGEIQKIISDKSMTGRTIGVVSLLGTVQTKYIYERLEQTIGFDKMEEYKIACGDARTFQGKERDIMFLTMVASKGDAYPLSRETFAQRFNVAASRARDRMYLVRSVSAEDLSSSDKYRHSLLQHFSLPFAQNEKRVENLRELCESGFEKEIYDILTE